MEDVAVFGAVQCQWTWQETMEQPAWLIWRLWRNQLKQSEQRKR